MKRTVLPTHKYAWIHYIVALAACFGLVTSTQASNRLSTRFLFSQLHPSILSSTLTSFPFPAQHDDANAMFQNGDGVFWVICSVSADCVFPVGQTIELRSLA